MKSQQWAILFQGLFDVRHPPGLQSSYANIVDQKMMS